MNKRTQFLEPTHIWYGVNDLNIHALNWNYTDEHTVVFLHGAMANSAWWQHIAQALETGQIYALDFSGHGVSDWASEYTLEAHAQEIVALVEAYAQGPVYLVGHSYGGAVAMYAAQFIESVNIVLVDTPLHLVTEHHIPSNKSYRKHHYSSKDEAIAHFKPVPNQPIENIEIFKQIAEQSIKPVDQGFTWQFDPSFHRRDVAESSQEMMIKMAAGMRYWYGEYSPFATSSTLEKAKRIGLQCTMIPKAYHAVMVDAPDALIDEMNKMTSR